ncbi:MAG: hypothetical protein IT458_06195 [Planctomycetes bacterium]|nr:hypothetical protein [Planctomycetota bacterium]
MKSPVLAVTAALLAASLSAQTPDNNRVEKNNNPWLVISSSKHPTTTNPYMYPPQNHPAYSFGAPATPGVPAGSKVFRWIPKEVNQRTEARVVSGFYAGMSLAAATPGAVQGYFPETAIVLPKARSGSTSQIPGQDPNTAVPAVFTLAKRTLTFPGIRTVANATFTPSVSVTQQDMVMTHKYEGGENDNVPATPTVNSQGYFGSWQDNLNQPLIIPATDGNIDGTSGVINYNTDLNFCGWRSYMEEEANLSQHSDWGFQRYPGLSPVPSGYSVGTYNSDLATTAGSFGWDVNAGTSEAGNSVVMLMNAGPFFPGSFPILGVDVNLNIADPALGLLAAAGYVGTLNAQGLFDGPALSLSPLGASGLGTTIGVQGFIVAASLTNLTENTQANWFKVVK